MDEIKGLGPDHVRHIPKVREVPGKLRRKISNPDKRGRLQPKRKDLDRVKNVEQLESKE